MGCVQSLFNPSKSRSSSPDRDFEPPKFETVPVTQQPKKSYNTSVSGISVDDNRVHRAAEFEDYSDDDMPINCNDFEQYALDIEDDQRSVHYVQATALTTLAASTSSVAILGTTAKCKSSIASLVSSNYTSAVVSSTSASCSYRVASTAVRRQRSSSPSPSSSSLPPTPRPPLIGSVSQPMFELNEIPAWKPPVDTGKKAVLSSTPEKETQELWLSEAQWAEHLATKSRHRAPRPLVMDTGPPPASPSPFSTSSPQWPLKWPVAGCSSNLDRIPVGVIEVLDCEPADQRRPPPTKAQRFPKGQRGNREQNIPLPVIHAMEMKSNSSGHDELFKTMRVQPPSSDKHGFRSRTGTGSSTFDSYSRKPFLRQSNETKSRYTDDDFSADTGWLSNIPVFAKCPPAKTRSLPSRDSITTTTTVEIEMADRQNGVQRGSSVPNYDKSGVNSSSRLSNDDVALIAPVEIECTSFIPAAAIDKLDSFEKSNDQVENNTLDVAPTAEKIDPICEPNEVQSDLKAEKEIENTQAVDQKNEKDVEEHLKNQKHEGVSTNNSSDSKEQKPELLETEYRLTLIHSVREAVNRICEQAVEKTAAIVRGHKRNSNSTLTSSFKDRDQSEVTDIASSEFSLPPPPQQHPLDSGPTGQESSWPPPPFPSEADEEQTIAPGYSFDLPDPPTEMDQMDSETDKLDISDEEMKATGLPSDDTDTEAGEGGAENDRPVNKIDAVMKSTANGGSSDGSVEAAMVVAQDNGADDRAATTIQAVYRGFRARKYVEAVNAAAVKIQAGFRGYRVRQSLKNAAPSTATTTTDESQCWSDDDQKSVVSVTYAPLKEYGCEPRGAGDGQGDDGSDDGGDGPSPIVGIGDSVSGVPGDTGGGRGDGDGGGVGDGHSGVGNVGGAHVGAGVGVAGVFEDDDDDEDQLQTGDDEVFERDDNDIGGGGGSVGNMMTNPTTTLSPATPTELSSPDDVAEAEALVQAAIKIQARVRGFAARKRLNDEKNDDADKK